MAWSGPDQRQRFRVVGVGTAGWRVVEPLRSDPLFASDGRAEARFAVVHTDAGLLESAVADRRVHVQRPRPDRFGLPRDESRWRDELDRELRGADLVIVVVDAAEVAAVEIAATTCRIARAGGQSLALAFEIVQSTGRSQLAEEDTARLIATADSTFLVPIGASPSDADGQIRQAIRALVQIARQPGLINYSLEEIVNSLRDAGLAQLATISLRVPLSEAARFIFASPTLHRPLIEARACFLHARTPPGVSLFELSRLGEDISAEVDPEANVWLTAHPDPSLEGDVEVTFFAAGLPTD